VAGLQIYFVSEWKLVASGLQIYFVLATIVLVKL